MDTSPVTVRVFDDGVDRGEVATALPAAALRSRITRYTSYWEHTRSFTARRELAATSGVLLYALDAPLEIVGADGRAITVAAGEAFVGGIADATSLSRALGPQAGIHVFMPLASLATVIGAPLAEIANCVAPFRHFAGAAADELGAALHESRSVAARFALLDRFLAQRLAREVRRDRAVEWSMQRLASSTGPQTTALAASVGWSRQHFIRRFRDVTGFSPDRFRRLARFERFVAALATTPQDGLAALAADMGYVDQAHLTHEVRDFSAMTPGELRARLLPEAGGVRD